MLIRGGQWTWGVLGAGLLGACGGGGNAPPPDTVASEEDAKKIWAAIGATADSAVTSASEESCSSSGSLKTTSEIIATGTSAGNKATITYTACSNGTVVLDGTIAVESLVSLNGTMIVTNETTRGTLTTSLGVCTVDVTENFATSAGAHTGKVCGFDVASF